MPTLTFGIQKFEKNDLEIIYEEKRERIMFAIVYHNLSFFYNKIIFIIQKIKQTRLSVFLFIK